MGQKRVIFSSERAGVARSGDAMEREIAMICPHCKVSMWPYETVKKSDGTYKRYECRIVYCKTCNGPCTHKELGHRPE